MPCTFGCFQRVIAAVEVLLVCAPPAFAQWLGAPAVAAPLLPHGEVDLEAPPPRHVHGRVHLQGVWMPDDNRYIRDLALDIGDDKVPYQPWARRLFDERKDGLALARRFRRTLSAATRAEARLRFVSLEARRDAAQVVILYETFTFWRRIFTDGRTVDPAGPVTSNIEAARRKGYLGRLMQSEVRGVGAADPVVRPLTGLAAAALLASWFAGAARLAHRSDRGATA